MKIIERDDSAALTERWEPDFLDNLASPEGQRAGFVLRKLSARDIERIERKTKGSAKSGKVNAILAAEQKRLAEARDLAMDAGIASIYGWQVQKAETGEVVEVTDWRALRDVLMAKASIGVAARELFADLYERITTGVSVSAVTEGE